MKPTETIPEPPPTVALAERPSSDPQRHAVRLDGITYSFASAAAATAFKAKHGRQPHHDEGFET